MAAVEDRGATQEGLPFAWQVLNSIQFTVDCTLHCRKGFYLAAEGNMLGLGTLDNRALLLRVEDGLEVQSGVYLGLHTSIMQGKVYIKSVVQCVWP